MVKLSSNKKMVAAMANSSGIGYANFANRPNSQEANGSVNIPITAMILMAMPYGRITSSSTIMSAGTTI